MSQPLGYAVGNWLEVVECIECMQGKNVPDLMEVTYVLGGAMVMLGGKAVSIEEGISKCKNVLQTGKAMDKFKELVRRQGGDVSFITNPGKYPKSKYAIEVKSTSKGYVHNIDALEVGFIGIMLGAGRMKVDDIIDPKAGIRLMKKVGDSVKAGDTLAIMQTDNQEILETAANRLEKAICVATEPCAPSPLIRAMINEEGIFPWHGLV